uniref:Cellulose biosynthesis protein n=1 Tax=Siphoviridae sp. ctYcY12 TaxID=2825550 RepID=A0A8S5TTY0_9CAUD|nr:MAG TPA: cellulose biosynthesis protein [Siphoviridae sp. ctYcY12]
MSGTGLQEGRCNKWQRFDYIFNHFDSAWKTRRTPSDP